MSVNKRKTSAFTIEERLELLNLSIPNRANIEITSYNGLLVDFMRKVNAKTIVKGLRAISDFEYEMQMALLNHNLENDIVTIFMMTSILYSFFSSPSLSNSLHRYRLQQSSA